MQKTLRFRFDEERQGRFPARLREVCRFTSCDTARSPEFVTPCWILDVGLTPNGLTRVNAAGWQSRNPGWAHLYPPGSRWVQDNFGLAEHESAYLLFDGGEVLGLEALTANAMGFARIHDPEMCLFERLNQLVELGMQRGDCGILAAHSLLYELADLLLHRTTRTQFPWCYRLSSAVDSPSDATLAGRVRDFLESHYPAPLPLAQIARAVGVSVSTLTHRYRAESGESVIATLRRIRLNHSIACLEAGQSLKATAAAVGLCDAFYFSKLFRRHFGVSPGVKQRNAGHHQK